MKNYILTEYLNGKLINKVQSNNINYILKHLTETSDSQGNIYSFYYNKDLKRLINGSEFIEWYNTVELLTEQGNVYQRINKK